MNWHRMAFGCLLSLLLGMTATFAADDTREADCRVVGRAVPACTLIIEDPAETSIVKAKARVSRARAYFATGDWASAIADYDLAIPLLPSQLAPYNERGVAHERNGSSDLALADYSKAIDLDPTDFRALSNRALRRFKNGAVDPAIADLNEAIRLNPGFPIAYNGRGVALSSKGEYRKAIDDFSAAISLNRFFGNAYANRGVAFTKIGEIEPAIQDLKTALKLDDSAHANRELAWTFLMAKRPAEGLPYADRGVNKDTNSANAYDTRGAIYESLGRLDLAKSDFEKALSLDPTLESSVTALSLLNAKEHGPATFNDVVRFVERQGWRIDMGDLCGKLGLTQVKNACVFRQLSIEDSRERSFPRGFNVAAAGEDGQTKVLIFHLNPLIGEFFIVSSDGALAEAYLRSKGSDYERVPNDVVRDEFEKDLMYWQNNFNRLTDGLRNERARSMAPP